MDDFAQVFFRDRREALGDPVLLHAQHDRPPIAPLMRGRARRDVAFATPFLDQGLQFINRRCLKTHGRLLFAAVASCDASGEYQEKCFEHGRAYAARACSVEC